MKNIFYKFESLTAFHAHLDRSCTPNFSCYEHSQLKRNGSDFCGCSTYEEADEKFLNGDRENANKIEQAGIAKARLHTKLNNDRRKIYTSVVGFAPHIPNYLSGIPTNMINQKVVSVKQKVLTLVYNISVGGSVTATRMESAAVNLLSAIMQAEAGGVRINLYVCDISVSDQQQIGWLVRIKNSGQHMDVLKMAYPLVNASMLRRHSFRFTEVTNGVGKAFVGNYGRASSNVYDMLKTCGLKDAKVLSFSDIENNTIKDILEKIIK